MGLGPPPHTPRGTAGSGGARLGSGRGAERTDAGGGAAAGLGAQPGTAGGAGSRGGAREGAGGGAEPRGAVRRTAELEGPAGGDPEAPGAGWRRGGGGAEQLAGPAGRAPGPPVTGPSPPRGPRVSGDVLLPPGLGASSRAPTAGGGTWPSGGSPGPAPRATSGCPVRPRPSRRYQSRKPTGR